MEVAAGSSSIRNDDGELRASATQWWRSDLASLPAVASSMGCCVSRGGGGGGATSSSPDLAIATHPAVGRLDEFSLVSLLWGYLIFCYTHLCSHIDYLPFFTRFESIFEFTLESE